MKTSTARAILKKVQKDYDDIADDFSETRKCAWKEFEEILEYFKVERSPIRSTSFPVGDDKKRSLYSFPVGDDKKASFSTDDTLRVLDVGCGNGRLFAFLSKHFFDVDYTGIDISKNLLQKARKLHPKARFKEADLLALPFSDAKFDVVFSIASFHHVPSVKFRKNALREMRRVLKKDSLLVLMVWNLWQKKYWKCFLRAFFRAVTSDHEMNDLFIPWQKKVDRYYHAFTYHELKRCVQMNGFRVEMMKQGQNILCICRKI